MPESDPAMQNAVFCLKGIEQSFGSYGELLTTYALLMVGESRLAQAAMFETLKSANRVYGLLWWESDRKYSLFVICWINHIFIRLCVTLIQ